MNKKIRLYNNYSSHMVLQADAPIRFFGTSAPGELLHCRFDGEEHHAAADSSGEWRVEFPAREAGWRELSLEVSSNGGDRVVLADLVVGEVWFCSGQSNMEMPIWSDNPHYRVNEYSEIMNRPPCDYLRFFNSLGNGCSTELPSPFGQKQEPADNISWSRCDEFSLAHFSAFAYYFGLELLCYLDCPVGIILASYGGSCIRSWISKHRFEQLNDLPVLSHFTEKRSNEYQRERIKKLSEAKNSLAAWLKTFRSAKKTAVPYLNGEEGCNWHPIDRLPFTITHPGVVWVMADFCLDEPIAEGVWQVKLGQINDCDQSYFNGILIGQTMEDRPVYWEHLRVYEFSANVLRAGGNTLSIRIENHIYSGNISGYQGTLLLISPDGRKFQPRQLRVSTEYIIDEKQIGHRPEVGLPRIEDAENMFSHNYPTSLFNGMIAPWRRFPFRGVVWYQGCHNIGESTYQHYLEELISDWREFFDRPQLPFVIIQLAGFYDFRPNDRGPEDRWEKLPPEEEPPIAVLREMQEKVSSQPCNMLATAVDVGDQYDVHPRNKKDPAARAAAIAARQVYQCDVPAFGPVFAGAEVTGPDEITVTFSHADGGLVTADGKSPGAFAVRGADGVLRWGQTALKGENQVVVRVQGCGYPIGVRYGFVDYRGDLNLRNRMGLPALPFRWEGGPKQ